MTQEPDSPGVAGTWLERKLAALQGLYDRFGRDGLKDQPITDVGLLLSFKEMEFRDAPKGRDLNEEQKALNRQLELVIKDLAGCLKGQVAGISLADLRSFRQSDRPQQQDQQRQQFRSKGRDMER